MSSLRESKTPGLYVNTRTFLYPNVFTAFKNVKFLPNLILAAKRNSPLFSV